MSGAQTSEQQGTAPATTPEEWHAAWKLFNAGLKELGRLARLDGVTIKLDIKTIGAKKKGEKR